MPFNSALFANVYNANFGNGCPAGEKQGDAGKAWAQAMVAGAATVLAPAPSSTISAAESSMAGALAGWNSNTDNAGNMLKSAIQLFAAGMVPGFAPSAAIPPAGPPPTVVIALWCQLVTMSVFCHWIWSQHFCCVTCVLEIPIAHKH